MDVNRLLVDICQALDPVKRNGLRTLVQELTAKKAAREIPSVTKALVERAPAVVGADLWRECCEKQRPRGDPVPEPPEQPAADGAPTGGGEGTGPPPTRRPWRWRCNWCQTSETSCKRRGPDGPRTLCHRCNQRWGRGETGPRSDDWSCGSCGVQETSRRWKGPKGPGTLCGSCGSRYAKGATGPPAENWRCDWCETSETRWRATGPKGPGTLCDTCGGRFSRGKTGPRPATFECRWCDKTSTPRRYDGPVGEGELCDICGSSYYRAPAKVKARLVRVETELDRLTSVPVIDAETGAETREPKRARDDDDAAPASGLKREKAQQDALVQVKLEKEALEDRVLCTICMEADAPRTVLFGPCNHFLVCASCADALQQCPNCRVPITARTSIANAS